MVTSETRYTCEPVKRTDGLWDWRLVALNGQIVATSGSQGYARRDKALGGFKKIARNLGVAEGIISYG